MSYDIKITSALDKSAADALRAELEYSTWRSDRARA